VGYQYNEQHLSEVVGAFRELIEYANLVITMPNADTAGSLYRQGFADFQQQNPQRVILIENFGSTNYFAAMKHSALLLGNTSSGILEAASLNKYVINAGDRQKGRIAGENVYHVPFERAKITETARHLLAKGSFTGPNPYKIGFAAELIRNVLIEQVNGK
jgi:GDP/UDP-N,N'-diacetylbacillosamine 2-epimerase (hydrolysing)